MFETPLFLIAALLGAMIPLVLHMMQKRRSLPVMFPTLRFLILAQKASSRSIRIEHLLLWLLRTLIMLLLGLAFAMPMLRTKGFNFLGSAPRDIAIVLDASYSMGYNTGRDQVWDKAIEIACSLIEGLAENDRFCIMLARKGPQALIAEPISDKKDGLARLKALRPEYETSRLAPAIVEACQALHKVTQRRQREVHIITDNQALAWASFGAEGQPNEKEGDSWRTDRTTTFFVTLLGVPLPENVAPREIDLSPPVLFAGNGARLQVRLAYSGPPRETTVSFFIDNEETARRSVMLGTPQAEQIEFAVPSLSVGTHVARVESPVDNLPVDDAFHFLIRVRDEMPSLIVGGETDTFFLRMALRAATDSEAFTSVEVSALADTSLDAYSCIFLCNALPLPGQTMTVLERFVQRGGLLVLFAGTRAGVGDYEAWRCLPGVPIAIREVPRTQSLQTLIWNVPEHPVLRTLGGAMTAPTIALQRFLEWDTLAEDAKPLISLSSNVPLMVERPLGLGSVVMFAVSADRSWSNFPLTPFYLPIIAKLTEYSGGLGSNPTFLWGADVLPVSSFLRDANSGVSLTSPQGLPVSLSSTVQDGHPVLYAENMKEPGVYLLSGGATGPEPAVAINMPREESDLAPIDPDSISGLIGVDDLHIATDRESLESLLYEHRVGRTYGELLLWIVLLLIGVEFVYANRLGRLRGQLTDQLTIAPSGRVRGRVSITPVETGGGHVK